MSDKHAGNVSAVLEMLLEEIGGHLDAVRASGAKALTEGDNFVAKSAIQFAEEIEGFQYRVRQLKDDWREINAQDRSRPTLQLITNGKKRTPKQAHKPKRIVNPAPSGKKTHQREYIIPILRALVRLGGSAHMRKVIELVGEMMRDKLKPIDFEPYKSGRKAIRWVNTTQWARMELVNLGLMKSGSPHGIWEISDKGRRHLEKHDTQSS